DPVSWAPLRVLMTSRHFNLSNCIRSPPARAGFQDIELARISQEVLGRFYNLYSVQCPLWVKEKSLRRTYVVQITRKGDMAARFMSTRPRTINLLVPRTRSSHTSCGKCGCKLRVQKRH